MDLTVRTETHSNEDHTWLGSDHGLSSARPIELDLSLFDVTPDTGDFPDGYIPSGVALGIVTASGQFGPYDNAAIDGRTVMRGHLAYSIPVASDQAVAGAALLEHGVVIEAKLPTNHGVDANGKTDIGSRIVYR